MKACAILTALLFLAASQAFGQELTQEFRCQEGFTVKLPKGWEAISKQSLDATVERAKQNMPNGLPMAQAMDYGFQQQNAPTGAEAPNIQVKINFAKRWPEPAAKDMQDIQRSIEEEFRELSKAAGMDLGVGQVRYDAQEHIMWIPETISRPQGATLGCLLGQRWTEKGLIHVACYADSKVYGQYEPLFKKIVREIAIDEDLAYKPTRIKIAEAIGQVIGIALIVAAVIWFKRKRKAARAATPQQN